MTEKLNTEGIFSTNSVFRVMKTSWRECKMYYLFFKLKKNQTNNQAQKFTLLLFAITFINFLEAFPGVIIVSSQCSQETKIFWIFRHNCAHTLFVKCFFPRKCPNHQATQYCDNRGINQTIFTQSFFNDKGREYQNELGQKKETRTILDKYIAQRIGQRSPASYFPCVVSAFHFVAHINRLGDRNRI